MEDEVIINGNRGTVVYRSEKGKTIVVYYRDSLGKKYTVYVDIDGIKRPYAWFDTIGEAVTYSKYVFE